MNYAYASITSDSGFQQQIFDLGGEEVDGYWIRRVSPTLSPLPFTLLYTSATFEEEKTDI